MPEAVLYAFLANLLAEIAFAILQEGIKALKRKLQCLDCSNKVRSSVTEEDSL